jgi:hypothetical protein
MIWKNMAQTESQGVKSVMKTRFSSMGWRIFLWMSGIALVPLIIMAYQGYHCARQAIVEAKEMHLSSILESRKIRFQDWYRQVQTDFRILAATPCVRDDCCSVQGGAGEGLSPESCNVLDHLRDSKPFYLALVTFDKQWKIQHPRDRTRGKFKILFPEEFKESLKDSKNVIFSSIIREKFDRLVLYAGHPLYGK